MPIKPTYPGVYIQEIPSGVHTITGVSTSVTAFIGRALRGPTDQPITINSYADFQRIFGGLWVESSLGYAVNDFFVNGGSQAIIVRVTDDTAQPALSSQFARSASVGLDLIAKKLGTNGNRIMYSIVDSTAAPSEIAFNLTITDTSTTPVTTESYTDLTMITVNNQLKASALINLIDIPTAPPGNTSSDIFFTGTNSSLSYASAPASLGLDLVAQKPGTTIGNTIKCSIANSSTPSGTTGTFDLTITDTSTTPATVEPYIGLTLKTANSQLNASKLVNLIDIPTILPANTNSDIFFTGTNSSLSYASAPASLGLDLVAQKPGITIGNTIKCSIANSSTPGGTTGTFDLTITDTSTTPATVEPYTGLTLKTVNSQLNVSKLVNLIDIPTVLPGNTSSDIFFTGTNSSLSYASTPASLGLDLVAQKPGTIGSKIKCSIAISSFDLTLTDNSTTPATVETYSNLTPTTISIQLSSNSQLVTLGSIPTIPPAATIDSIFLQNGTSSSYARSPNLGLDLVSQKAGMAGSNITYSITNSNAPGGTTGTFNLAITDSNTTNPLPLESYKNLNITTISSVLSASKLVTLIDTPVVAPSETNGTVFLIGGSDSSMTGSLFAAANPGVWGNNLQISVNYDISDDVAAQYGLDPTDLFNLVVTDTGTGAVEQYNNVTVITNPSNPGQIDQVLLNQSQLVVINRALPATKPLDTNFMFSSGSDGGALNDLNILGNQANKTGLYALEISIFNLLCIPGYIAGYNNTYDIGDTVLTDAAAYCAQHKAFFVIDAPSNWTSTALAQSGVQSLINLIGKNTSNCAVYFPRIQEADPLSNNQLKIFGPCGMIAGAMANIDGQRGIWKAPAGLETSLAGVAQLTVSLTDPENGQLNPIAVNCLRTFPASGTVIWGARTLQGNDLLNSDWKYIPVRRFALYLEQSIYNGTQWAVFEPNDAPLWRQLVLTINSFMNILFRQGAFQGQTAQQAYFVKCDSETTTQDDIDNGIVNVLVGFAPLKPAEFVVISIQQIAGQN